MVFMLSQHGHFMLRKQILNVEKNIFLDIFICIQ